MKRIKRKSSDMSVLLRKLAVSNPKLVFLFNRDGYILADSKYLEKDNKEIGVGEVNFPKEYNVLPLLANKGEKKKTAHILDSDNTRIAILNVVNSLKEKDERVFDGFREFIYEEKKSQVVEFFSNVGSRVKNTVTNLFTKRADATYDFKKFISNYKTVKSAGTKKTEPTKISAAIKAKTTPVNKPTVTNKPQVVEDPTKISAAIKAKTTSVNKPTVINKPQVVEDPTKINKKENEYLDKKYALLKAEEYNKLGSFEKMFIDDVKAECLSPSDNEFRMMLNERAVNKEAILNYYNLISKLDLVKEREIKRIQTKKVQTEFAKNKSNITDEFAKLGEFEKMFVEDAFAENLDLEDNEFNMMLNERTVNKNEVISFMKAYKESLLKQDKLVKEYAKLTGSKQTDYSKLTINELRKAASAKKQYLTVEELEKRKNSSLKKEELVKILTRIEAKEQIEDLAKKLR